MTHILNRLEKRRLIERMRDTQDRRKVFIRVRPEGLEPLIPKYEEIGEAYMGLADQYDDRQLKLICDYTERAAEISKHALANLITANRSRSSQAKPGLGLRDRRSAGGSLKVIRQTWPEGTWHVNDF